MNMKNIYRLLFFLLCVTFSFQAFSQSARLRQLADDTGISVSASAPVDTTVTWRKTTDGKSYFWDVETQAWQLIKYDFEVDSVGAIILKSFPDGARVITKGYYSNGDGGGAEYFIVNSKTGYENEDTLGAVWATANGKFAIMDTNLPINVFAIGARRSQDIDGNDDTDALQRVIDYTSKTLWHDVIYVPRGFMDINETLFYDGNNDNRGVTIQGDSNSGSSSYGSSFIFRGSNNDTVFHFDHINNLFIRNIDINGNSKAKIGIHISPLSQNIRIENVNLAGFSFSDGTYSAAIDTELSGLQVSEIYLTGGRINGCTYGIKAGNANNKNFYIEGLSFQNNDTCVHITKTDNLSVYKSTFAGNGVSVACFDCSSTSIISNEIEGDDMFFHSGGNSAVIEAHNLIGNFVSLAPGNKTVIAGDGRLNLLGNTFKQNDGSAVQIQWGNNINDAVYSVSNFIHNSLWDVASLDRFPYLNNGGTSVLGTNVISLQNIGGPIGDNAVPMIDYTQKTTTATEQKLFNVHTFTADDVNNDKVVFTGRVQMDNALYTGVSGQSFSLVHNNEATTWFNDNVLFSGKHITSGFGLGIRGFGSATKGIDQSGGALASSSGLGIFNNSIEAITITSTGNTGIGIVPTEKLQINGNCVISGSIYLNAAKTLGIFTGTGSPEGAITAAVGSTFHRTDGGASTTYYVKESGTGNIGWVAK